MKNHAMVWFLALAVLPALAAATGAPTEDPIAAKVFPPELVMKHDEQIGLTDRQRETIKAEIQQSQGKFLGFQWQMQKHVGRLVSLLDARPVDEGKMLAQADAVMQLEMDIKKTHLTMLVRIKNLLTPEQQGKLEQLRQAAAK